MRDPVNPTPSPLPGLASDAELVAGRRVVRCGMCNRPLKDRDARLRGAGEHCRAKLGADPIVRTPGRFDVPQDELPET